MDGVDIVEGDARADLKAMAQRARTACHALGLATSDARRDGLYQAARIIRARMDDIVQANARDMAYGAEKNLSPAMMDRLLLPQDRIEAMATGVEAVADLPDPVGQVLQSWDRPNGLQIDRVRTPLGVIGVIYES
ncbi:MAG TPA: gamma-glutamyl-phosphate reductase, partial [Rhodospirillaceae bacterium]|nr:gamma-glutamyl-phosphate reductase [Rhodospirillaceae bacterium]